MYIVEIHDDDSSLAPVEFPTREQAVRAARELSEQTFRPVKVLNAGRWERLVYRRGELLEGLYVTRDRRRQMCPLP